MAFDEIVAERVREMDFTGRPLKGFVYVDSQGFASAKQLRDGVARCQRFAASLPPKVLRAPQT
ncbi:MAG: hypothetical protein O3C57_03260 [Verrucomicrobia bacterium]|nr:hypothetical protein [Verrucomicrobiota bacterium]